MKRFLLCLLIGIVMSLAVCTASAETLGWGFVNNTEVALRRGVGGKVIYRLPKDTCVWINDSQIDGNGVLWYEIRTGLHVDNANYDFSGWMKAEFIDAGEAVWHDITAIGASNFGLIVLRTDGSTETAGCPIVAMDGAGWVSPKGWANTYGKAIHVGVPNSGNDYIIVTESNEFVSSGDGIPVSNGLARAAALEAAEAVIKDVSFPAWSSETIAFRSMGIANPDEELPIELYVGITAEGSVIAEPSLMADLLADWSDIIDIRLTDRYVLGLKKDGTAKLAAFSAGVDLDVSQWQGVIAIGAGKDWCVGLKEDGTLVFDGDHVFMNEGHSRK